MKFQERLATKIKECGSPICLGIDPHISKLPRFMEIIKKRDGELALVEKWVNCLIDMASPRFPSVKFQSAFFESMGWRGFKLLEDSITRASKAGLLTILDAKRGDISSTMSAYGQMAFDQMKADCLTVTPYMGYDAIRPLRPWLQSDKGIYVVWISSNPSGEEVQQFVGQDSLTLADSFLMKLTSNVDTDNIAGSVGLVLGATKLSSLSDRTLEIARGYPLLMPGVGAQGAKVSEKLVSLLADGFHLLPMSRGIAGLGDVGQSAALDGLADWQDYSRYLSLRADSAVI